MLYHNTQRQSVRSEAVRARAPDSQDCNRCGPGRWQSHALDHFKNQPSISQWHRTSIQQTACSCCTTDRNRTCASCSVSSRPAQSDIYFMMPLPVQRPLLRRRHLPPPPTPSHSAVSTPPSPTLQTRAEHASVSATICIRM